MNGLRQLRQLHLLALPVLLACLLPLHGAADERILEYRTDIRVEPNGELAVTETIRVQAEGQDIRRGIYRDFPTAYRDRFGNRVQVDFVPLVLGFGADDLVFQALGHFLRFEPGNGVDRLGDLRRLAIRARGFRSLAAVCFLVDLLPGRG